MGKRKVTILEPAVEAVSKVAFFIEGKGLPETAKRFVDNAFEFFESLQTNGLFIGRANKFIGNVLTFAVLLFAKNMWLLI